MQNENIYRGDYKAECYINEEGKGIIYQPINDYDELEFAVFCIEKIAKKKKEYCGGT